MINLLIGPPGGGKSYEAVVYHILPALQRGRKVITNLPLDLDRLALIDSSYVGLVEIRTSTKAVEPEKDWAKAESLYKRFGIAAKTEFFSPRPFANPEDYGDLWRHPDPNIACGPFYVIDECHLSLPRTGTKRAVEEWFSLHRHETADVLLITQSYGKVSRPIIDLVQVCYRVKKATAFGSATKYVRKVQDGVRGEVVNTAIRTYEKRYFGLYKSHTRGGGAELVAEDIVPIWKRWPFVGAAVMFVLAAVIFASSGAGPVVGSPPASAKPSPAAVVAKRPSSEGQGMPGPEKSPEKLPEQKKEAVHPYAGRTLHVLGSLTGAGRRHYVFTAAQNGQRVHDLTGGDLESLGYLVEPGTDCAVRISHGQWSQWIICDAPSVSVLSASAPQVSAKPASSVSQPDAQGVVIASRSGS